MKKVVGLAILVCFLFTVSPAYSALTTGGKVQKLQSEITVLQKKLQKVKNKTQAARIKKTIKGHQARIQDLNDELAAQGKPLKLEITKIQIIDQKSVKVLTAKGGLAGGALLIGASYAIPMGPGYVGGELGYAIGNQFGVLEAGALYYYPIKNYFVGFELGLASYSKKVQDVPGLSGNIEGGRMGIGLVSGGTIGQWQYTVGYNTGLGLKADAGYMFYL